MPSPTTEMLHDDALGLDQRPLAEVAEILVSNQITAAQAVHRANASLCEASRAMASSLASGGRLFYVAAGSSALMAAADAMELGGTFGINSDRVRIVMAGGLPTSSAMPGDTEDATSALATDLADLASGDTLIAVAASGTTPFTLAAAEIARARGATLVGLANNPDAPLLALADIAVLLATPPEVISGSTRMGAATAQKIALNTMSTLMAIELGHIHDGMMVNLVADNAKLRGRALGIVRRISGADETKATEALAAAQGQVKPAVLIAAGAASTEAAQKTLDDKRGNLREALKTLRGE